MYGVEDVTSLSLHLHILYIAYGNLVQNFPNRISSVQIPGELSQYSAKHNYRLITVPREGEIIIIHSTGKYGTE